MAEDQKTDDLATTAMKHIIETVRDASAQDDTPITDIKLLIGLLETAGSLAALLRLPDEVLEVMVNVSFASAESRVKNFRTKCEQAKAQADTPEPARPVVPSLTEEQVRELLVRMKEGGRVH